MGITIRPYQEGDAHLIAELYNRHRDNPNPVAGGITGAELERELAERDTATVLVATDDDRVVGTFGLFRNTGRRSTRAGELIADMFFVAPAYRGGVITGKLFTEAVEWMMRCGCLVLRLTVNPANSVAFKLYRRVGCVSVGQTVPGEDGNVELHNYIPLILRSVYADLGPDVRAALGRLQSFANVMDSRDDELRSDVTVVDGVRTIVYGLAVGDFQLTASVDVDQGRVREAELTEPDGTRRPLRITEPPYHVRAARSLPAHRFARDGLECEVDGDDGTLRVFAAGHHGPVFTSTWPGCRADTSSGWREGQPADLEITGAGNGLRIAERDGDDEVVCTVTLDGGVLAQDFTFTGRPGRLFQSVGLRQGTFAHCDPDGGTTRRHPIGLGVGVRDAAEVVAAAEVAGTGSELTWVGATTLVQVTVTEPVRLIHNTLMEPRLTPGDDGVARLRTVFRPVAEPAAGAPARPAARSAGAVRRLQVHAAAGGVTSWVEGSEGPAGSAGAKRATKVLRSPFPRARAFACNPRWSAGMWVSAERGRFSRESGLGWGLGSNAAWEQKDPFGLFAARERIGWQVTAPEDAARSVRVDVQAPEVEEEVALWLTPHTPARTRVVIRSAGTRWELDSSTFRQVWAEAVSVRLTDGGWLCCHPVRDAAGDDAEIVVRATPAGLLVGCVSAARRPHGADAAWHFAVSDTAGL
jgi:GNAT superfamily N-acetyltransferase